MSGLAGILHRSARPVPEASIERMVQSMHYRGPHGLHVWSDSQAMLGQCTLQSSRFSDPALPGQSTTQQRIVVVGDVRIDNRADLLGICGYPSSDHPAARSDLSLVALLYERKGGAFIDEIDGDFAFALYDAADRSVRCYRDHFGTRPFYFFLDDDYFVFASDIKAILTSGLVTSEIEQSKLEDYLVGNLADQEKTFYKGIRKLQSGTSIYVDSEKVDYHRYWSIAQDESEVDSTCEMEQEFRRLFLDAVNCRLGDAGSTSFLLSVGGLDSSSVVCSAAHVAHDRLNNFRAYSVEFPYLPEVGKKRSDEREYVDEVVRHTGIASTRLTGMGETPLSSLTKMLEIQDEPFLVPNAYLDAIALSAVHNDGSRVLLTGLEGDLTVSHGDSYLSELVYRRDWAAFVRESHALAGRTDTDPSLFLERYAMPPLQKMVESGEFRAFRHGVRSLSSVFGRSAISMLWNLGLRSTLARFARKLSQRETAETSGALRFVKRDYPLRKAIVERVEEGGRNLAEARTQRDHHLAQLQSGYAASLLEFAEKNAANWQINVRHPFFDRKLVEYSVSLPGSSKLSNGWTRYIMRASMEQILPENVRWRAQKAALGPNFAYLMARESEDHIRALADTAAEAFPYIIDKTSVSSLLDRRKYATLWRILVLGGWVLQNRP